MELILQAVLKQEVRLLEDFEIKQEDAELAAREEQKRKEFDEEKPEFNSTPKAWKKSNYQSKQSRIDRANATCIVMLSGLFPSEDEP